MGKASPKRNPPRRLRIVAGTWRGRYIKVPPHPSVRPTPARVRETVFNWLAGELEGARCLDLYAGSGVLGFEAASRGAQCVTLVERHRATANFLRAQAEILQAPQVKIVCANARDYLAKQPNPVDIVFLDPPFSDAEVSLEAACAQLAASPCLKPTSLVYVEAPANQQWSAPASWEALKSQQAGQVRYHLFTTSAR